MFQFKKYKPVEQACVVATGWESAWAGLGFGRSFDDVERLHIDVRHSLRMGNQQQIMGIEFHTAEFTAPPIRGRRGRVDLQSETEFMCSFA